MAPLRVAVFTAAVVVGVAAPPFPVSDARVWRVDLDHSGRAALSPADAAAAHGPGPAAWGSFVDKIESTGWSVLDVHTSERYAGEQQSYAAGYLEGALTHERMAQHQRNMWGVDFYGRPVGRMPPAAAEFSDRNLRWMRAQVAEHAERDPYWRMVGYLLEQLRGLSDGFNEVRRRESYPPVPEAQVLMQSVVDTDMDDLVTAIVENGEFVNAHYRHRVQHAGRTQQQRRHRGHCSALIQAAPGNADLWTGHVTWDEYRAMLRVVKYFDMPLPGASARRMSFTSNPGALYSGDDWYVTDQGLTVLETSIENYNAALWQRVHPESVLTWVRAMVANRLATTGKEWVTTQVRHQSGTCNNQWMVVDYKKFTPGEALKNDTLWVAETMPGYTHCEDMTHVLVHKGSWPSFNIPYFAETREVGGYTAMQRANPELADQYSWSRDVRARMFARAAAEGEVQDMASFMKLLRYVDPRDPMAGGNPCNAISARCDLNDKGAAAYDCFGGIDAKVTGYKTRWDDLSYTAISAPACGQEVSPFSWHGQDEAVEGCSRAQHEGHPKTFDFSWYTFPTAVGATHIDGHRLHLSAAGAPQPWLASFLAAAACAGAVLAGVAAVAQASRRSPASDAESGDLARGGGDYVCIEG